MAWRYLRSHRQSLLECGTKKGWCHSAAQLGDVVTKDSDAARVPWKTVRSLWFSLKN